MYPGIVQVGCWHPGSVHVHVGGAGPIRAGQGHPRCPLRRMGVDGDQSLETTSQCGFTSVHGVYWLLHETERYKSDKLI